MLIVKIKLPKSADAQTFVSFMRDEYLPAVDRDPKRNGQISDVRLIQGQTTENTHEFLLYAEGIISGQVPLSDKTVEQKFETFHPRIKTMGFYREVAKLPTSDSGAVAPLFS